MAARVIPKEIVRDLLGICRILWDSRKAAGAGPEELAALEDAGKAFSNALSMAHCSPDTVGSRAAWSWSTKGLKLLGEALSGGDATASDMVASWGSKLKQFPETQAKIGERECAWGSGCPRR